MMNLNFNANAYQPQQPMEPVTEGWYPVMITEAAPQAVKDKPTLWYIKIENTIIDGPYKGRKVFDNINLGHDNQQTVDIAQRQLSAYCHVTGRLVINDPSELKGVPFQIKVTVDGNNNRVKGLKDQYGNDPGKTGAGQPNAQTAPAAMPPSAPPQQAAGGWGAPPPAAAAPGYAPPPAAAGGAPAWGAPPAQQAAPAPQAAPGGAAPWGGQQGGGQPAPGGAPWGAGAPAPAAPAPAPAAPGGWAPSGAPAGGAAPWAR